MGIALDPNFATNGWVYVYYAPDSANNGDPANFFSRVSRFTVGSNNDIDPASEKVIITVPASREPDEPGHTGGNLDFDLQGNLLLGVGDDVNPHSEPSGGYAPLNERADRMWDARQTSANTNDLRGKLLRIKPKADGGYDIPAGNLFPVGTEKTRPEIYAMGFRNPWKFSVDPTTGWIGLADYAPDNSTNAPNTRGPAGIVEYNVIKEPGNYGWPLCMGNNEPFRDVDYMTTPVTVGPFFDCANPVNDSIKNTGLVNLPPAKAPEMWYGYTQSSVPGAIPPGGGLAPMGGPFYSYDAASTSDTKFPPSYDGKAFYYDWAKNRVWTVQLNDTGKVEKVNPFMPNTSFLAPQSLSFGPDGSLYALEWGGGFGRDNPNSGIYRIDYINGSRSPVAVGSATPDNGQEPLSVTFSSLGSADPEGGTLTYAWDFDGNGTTDSTSRQSDARLHHAGRLPGPPDGHRPGGQGGHDGHRRHGRQHEADGQVQRPRRWRLRRLGRPRQLGLDGHRRRGHGRLRQPDRPAGARPRLARASAARVPRQDRLGRHRSRLGPLGGHEGVLRARRPLHGQGRRHRARADRYGHRHPAAQAQGGRARRRPARHDDGRRGRRREPDAGPGRPSEGQWASYDPVNFTGIDSVSFRVAATHAGGSIELRKDSPTGDLLGTATVPSTGSTTAGRT